MQSLILTFVWQVLYPLNLLSLTLGFYTQAVGSNLDPQDFSNEEISLALVLYF